jgi:enoyl-CoA hydratase/carnithine racemase
VFVFKAAVVGSGALAATIAEAIEAAGIALAKTEAGSDRVDLRDVDIAIVVPDESSSPEALFTELDAATPGSTILASCAPSPSITELGDATIRPDKVVGLHFFPAGNTRIVEVVEGDWTSPETVRAAVTFVQRLRLAALRCADTPGFVVDRVLGSEIPDSDERFGLLRLVEACHVIEDGVATMREVDLGISPRPTDSVFAGADRIGLDATLTELQHAAQRGDMQLEPPVLLRQLVAQGRTGVASGQGFYPYPRPDAGWEERPIKLETREQVAIAWLDRPPANSISAEFVATMRELWDTIEAKSSVRALVVVSANPQLFCAGADLRTLSSAGASDVQALVEATHGLLRDFERSSLVTIAAVNGLALGGGCELAMGCDLRVAAQSASFGQPEIGLGIIPGFGGTQRLPRLIGTTRAIELNLSGESIGADEAQEFGLVNEVVADHQLFDAALAWGRRLARQPPAAIAAIKRVSAAGDLDAGLQAERQAFAEVFAGGDAREGLAAFFERRPPRFSGDQTPQSQV